jgi:hypothetical protein
MTELDPVHLGIGEQAVDQDDRPAAAKLPPREADTIGRGEVVGLEIAQSGYS